MIGLCGKEIWLQRAKAGMVNIGGGKTLRLKSYLVVGSKTSSQCCVGMSLPCQYSTYLPKSSSFTTGFQTSPSALAGCSHRGARPQCSSVPHYSLGSTSVAISTHSSLWFTVASLSASYSLPKHLGEQEPVSGFGHLAQMAESYGKPRDTLWRCNILVLVSITFL